MTYSEDYYTESFHARLSAYRPGQVEVHVCGPGSYESEPLEMDAKLLRKLIMDLEFLEAALLHANTYNDPMTNYDPTRHPTPISDWNRMFGDLVKRVIMRDLSV